MFFFLIINLTWFHSQPVNLRFSRETNNSSSLWFWHPGLWPGCNQVTATLSIWLWHGGSPLTSEQRSKAAPYFSDLMGSFQPEEVTRGSLLWSDSTACFWCLTWGQFYISRTSTLFNKSRAFVAKCGQMRTGPLLFGSFFGCDSVCDWTMKNVCKMEAEAEDRFYPLRQIPHSCYFWMAFSASLATYSNGIKTFASVCWVSLFKSHESYQCWRQRRNTRAGGGHVRIAGRQGKMSLWATCSCR